MSPSFPVGGDAALRARLPEARARLCSEDREAATAEDLALLEGTNLQSPLSDIEYHDGQGTLRECWLITTRDVEYPDGGTEHGSAPYAPVLESWFFHRHPEARRRVTFHFGEALCVHPRDYPRMWLLVDGLFESCPYKARNMIVDITPGQKP